MKIAIVTYSFPPQTGGVQRYLYEVCSRLGQRHEIVILTTVAGKETAKFRRHILSSGQAIHIWQALQKEQPDRILLGHAHPQLLLAALLHGRFATLNHGNDYLAAQLRWHRPFFNALLKRSRPLITTTQANVSQLQSLGISCHHIVYPGIDPTTFQLPISPPPLPFKLLTVGRLVPRKGVDQVIYALPKILVNYPDLVYWVVGDGPELVNLEALAEAVGVRSHVHFKGRVAFAKLQQCYQQAHLFVMPAREEPGSMEGFGIVYLEAAASGLPVIAGRSGGAVEAVCEGKTGLLVEPTNPTDIAANILALLNDPSRRMAMGQAGRQWVTDEMSWKRAANRLEHILLEATT